MVKAVCEPTVTFIGAYPIEETTKTDLGPATFRAKLPVWLVAVEFLLPLSVIVAFGTPTPALSTTVPVMGIRVPDWEKTEVREKRRKPGKSTLFFLHNRDKSSIDFIMNLF